MCPLHPFSCLLPFHLSLPVTNPSFSSLPETCRLVTPLDMSPPSPPPTAFLPETWLALSCPRAGPRLWPRPCLGEGVAATYYSAVAILACSPPRQEAAAFAVPRRPASSLPPGQRQRHGRRKRKLFFRLLQSFTGGPHVLETAPASLARRYDPARARSTLAMGLA